MIRIIKLSGTFYGVEMTDENEEEFRQIEQFVSEGNPVIIVESLHDLHEFGIRNEIQMVTRD